MPNIPYVTKYKHTKKFVTKNNKSYSKPEHAKLYNSRRWRGLRNLYYKRNPLCVECSNNNILKEGYCVDHIKPVSEKILEDFKDNKDLELTKTKLKELPKEIIDLYNKQMDINNLDEHTI